MDRFTELMGSESPRSYRSALGVLAALFIPAAVLEIVQGAAPIAGPWDVMQILDDAWRMYNGQVPHVDFHNPIGDLTYLLVLFGMKVGKPSVSAICYGIVLLLAAIVPWTWAIASRRLPACVAFVLTVFLGFLLLAPRPLSYGIRETTYAMLYNREGYIFLSMLMLALFLPPRPALRDSPLLTGLSAGLLLALMFYCKITYFLIGGATLLVCLPGRPRAATLLGGIAIAGAAATLIVAAGLHIDPRAYLADVASAASSQSLAMRARLFAGACVNQGLPTYLLALSLALWTWAERWYRSPKSPPLRQWLEIGWVLLAALLIDSGNAAQVGADDDPLFVTAGVLLIEFYRRRNLEPLEHPHAPQRVAYAASLLLVLPLICGLILGRDLASFAYVAEWNLIERPHYDPTRILHSERLLDFRVPATTAHITSYWPARDHPANINDGIDLLRRNLRPGERVTTLAHANPFSFALGIPPAHDGPQWWDLNFSFDPQHYPPVASVLGEAPIVMVPKFTDRSQGWNFDVVDVLLRVYGPYLEANFELQDQSSHWLLYRRRGR